MATVLEHRDIGIEANEADYEPIAQGLDRVVLRLPHGLVTPEEFFAICHLNHDLRLEREANGDIILMAPAAPSAGRRNSKISAQLENWSARTQTGEAFDSSAGYELPNGMVLSPDASWIPTEQWEVLTPEQQDRFLPFFPVFAVELLSLSDRLPPTRKKMQKYMAHGTQLAWLINPKKSQVEVYEPGKDAFILDHPMSVSADPVLPGFVLDLTKIWK